MFGLSDFDPPAGSHRAAVVPRVGRFPVVIRESMRMPFLGITISNSSRTGQPSTRLVGSSAHPRTYEAQIGAAQNISLGERYLWRFRSWYSRCLRCFGGEDGNGAFAKRRSLVQCWTLKAEVTCEAELTCPPGICSSPSAASRPGVGLPVTTGDPIGAAGPS